MKKFKNDSYCIWRDVGKGYFIVQVHGYGTLGHDDMFIGTIVSSNIECRPIGYSSRYWDQDQFKHCDMHGSILPQTVTNNS